MRFINDEYGKNTQKISTYRTNKHISFRSRLDYEHDVRMYGFLDPYTKGFIFVIFWVDLRYVGQTVGPNRKLSLSKVCQK